jgi:hypothetical protein
MSKLFQLVIFLCSFVQAEYVLYKYDGTELTEQEHRKAYQILLEQQWPTAPAFNKKYNPEIDEEVEIAKRLKAEVPTVYARWIPNIVYEFIVDRNINWAWFAEEKFENVIYFSQLNSNRLLVDDSHIVEFGKDINTLAHFVAIHKKANKFLQIALNEVALNHEDGDLTGHYYKIMTGKSIDNKDIFNETDYLVFKILLLEEHFKFEPNTFLLFRASPDLPERDFSLSRLQRLKEGLFAAHINKPHKIRLDHLHNISYGITFFAGRRNAEGRCPYCHYIDYPKNQYGYVLPLKKSHVLSGAQLFGIPPLMTLISSFFCEPTCNLFHPRAFTLITDELKARSDVQDGLSELMRQQDAGTIDKNDTWHNYWMRNDVLSRLLFQLDSSEEVVKQAALRNRYIVENAIPLNDATKVLIESARAVYESIRKENPIEHIVPKSLPERVKDIFYSLNFNRYDFLAITIALILDYYSVPKKIWSMWVTQ